MVQVAGRGSHVTTRIGFRWLRAGHCLHPECIVQRGGRCRLERYPALVGLLLHPSRGPVLFDTGYSERFQEATSSFPERLYRWVTPVTLEEDEPLTVQLARWGVHVEDVRHVVLSHLHADHVAGLSAFPSAQLHLLQAEWDEMRRRGRLGRLRRGLLRSLLPAAVEQHLHFADGAPRRDLPAPLAPLGEGFDIFGDGSVLGVPLPGHSAGQMGLSFTAGSGRHILLTADACWSIGALDKDQLPTWLATSVFADRRAYKATFHALRALRRASREVLMLPSHCQASWEDVRDESL